MEKLQYQLQNEITKDMAVANKNFRIVTKGR